MNALAAIGWKVVPEISLGPLSVSPHGLGIAVGYAAGGSLLARRAERLYGIKRDHVWNMLMWAVLGVIVGARLFFVVGHIDDYIGDPLSIFRVWEGGIVFYGGAIGGIVAAYPYARKHKIPFLPLLDAAAPGFPLGLIFGRIGDLVIGDHLGGLTSQPWGFRYEGGRLPACPPEPGICPPPIGTVYHQTALYDLVSVILLLPVVMWLGRRVRPAGWLIGFTGLWYAAARFVSDFARADAPKVLGISGTQWVSIAIIVIGGVGLTRLARRPAPAPSGLGDHDSAPLDSAPPDPDSAPLEAQAEPEQETTSETEPTQGSAPSERIGPDAP